MQAKYNPEVDDQRARLLDMVKGGGDVIELQRYRFKYDAPAANGGPGADDTAPLYVPVEEWRKFNKALVRYYAAQGQEYDGEYYAFKFGHSTHQEAVEEARHEYADAPALVLHEDGLLYMHNEDKDGRPVILDVLITEILQ